MNRESGWELGSCSNDVLANTADKKKVNLEGSRGKMKILVLYYFWVKPV